MKYENIIADSHEEAIMQAKKKFGDEARIVYSKDIKPTGVFGFLKKKKVSLLVSISDDDYLKRYKKQLGLENKAKEIKKAATDHDTGKPSVKNEVPVSQSMDSDTISRLMEKMEKIERKIGGSEDNAFSKHKNISEIRDILVENEFSDEFIDNMINDIETKLPISKIEDKIELHKYSYDYLKGIVSGLVGNDEIIYSAGKNVMILVGATGVGKTTTIAKIAANSYINEKKKVELVTIDGFRIGAKYQLGIYAEHMKMNLHFAESRMEIEKAVTLSDADLILIDTIGRSQQDELKLVEMKSILKMRNTNAVFVLAVSATTKPREVKKIFKNFDIFDYTHVIITKNDESDTIGSIISAATDRKKKILFYTTGQKVPTDIEKASVDGIMGKINGFDPSIYLLNAQF